MVGEKFDFLNSHRLRGRSSPCNWWQHDILICAFYSFTTSYYFSNKTLKLVFFGSLIIESNYKTLIIIDLT